MRFFTCFLLEIYSPKFLALLENIENNSGSHLIYSQFRTLEGIGIFTMVLNQNGFAQFQIKQVEEIDEQGIKKVVWRIVVKPGDEDKPKYALYTGTEETEEKEILRKIFNGDWDNIPSAISEQLQLKANDNKISAELNNLDECPVFLHCFSVFCVFF